MANLWQPTRLALLVVTFSSTLLVLGKAIVVPKVPKVTETQSPSTLPSTVPLPHWQALSSKALKLIPEATASQQYEYQPDRTPDDRTPDDRTPDDRNTPPLTVALHYMRGDGDVNRFLFVHTPIQQANVRLVVKYQPTIGFYGVMPYQGRAYLSACISPRGESTVTAQQFVENLRAHDLTPSRLLPWLAGQQPLLDRRCLWTLMSVPLPPNADVATQNTAYKTLETAWFDWYRWWQPRFPPAQASG